MKNRRGSALQLSFGQETRANFAAKVDMSRNIFDTIRLQYCFTFSRGNPAPYSLKTMKQWISNYQSRVKWWLWNYYRLICDDRDSGTGYPQLRQTLFKRPPCWCNNALLTWTYRTVNVTNSIVLISLPTVCNPYHLLCRKLFSFYSMEVDTFDMSLIVWYFGT